MLLLIDNYDSFTFNLKDYFCQLGEEVMVVKNDEIDVHTIRHLSFNKIVISPGPNTPDEAGNLMPVIEAVHKQFPILGICLGHQALGQFFGAELGLALKPMHGKVSSIRHDQLGIYKNQPDPLAVCRYHSLVLSKLDGTLLKQTAVTEEGECMGFEHRELPITGIQYHPEAILTPQGMAILRNWLQLIS